MKDKHDIENRFQCELCKKYYVTEENLRFHINQGACLQFRCLICNLHFTRQKDLDTHQNSHRNIERELAKPFPCKLCPTLKAFTTQYWLKDHYRKVHGEIH